ncbi:MAG: sodium:proton antiporter [Labrys sp. (in: a-proteobacteria)]
MMVTGRLRVGTLAAAALVLLASTNGAFAAAGFDGSSMGAVWVIPFVGILLSIALGPLVFPHFWHHHYGKIAVFWALCVIVPMMAVYGLSATTKAVLHALLLEYMSFIILLFALFTIAGGVLVRGNIHGSPAVNTGLLASGAILASFIGTTGASMILIRPMIRANDNRRHNVHVVIFFIFLVSNIGGSLTPLGDPPLFVGFLRGVDFFWTTQHLLIETLVVAALALAAFYAIDTYFYRKEGVVRRDPTPDTRGISVHGTVNFLLIGGVIAAILFSAAVKLGTFEIYGVVLRVEFVLRDAVLVILALVSLGVTQKALREENGFNWEPILEVAKLFFGIFICIVPVLAILAAGQKGIAAPLVAMVTSADGTPNNVAYFWLTGILSSFLDNVPTYLVFFELAAQSTPAGANPAEFMMGYVPGHEAMATTLMAISTGAVFMGANTYIGNAPNFMVYAVAKSMGVRMPSFFGYMAWSGLILVPIFLIITPIFFFK